MLKWLRAEGCPWDKWACEFAAKGGHQEVLKWLKDHGCPKAKSDESDKSGMWDEQDESNEWD